MKRALIAGTAALLLCGWDTSEDPVNDWAAAYLFNIPTNEHASISDTTLRGMVATTIAVDGNSDEFLQVVDLNASYFRRGQLSTHLVGDDPTTTLEERDVPSPAHLAGVPDFSWTIYDWINKNSICPSVPPEAQTFRGVEVCHEYKGWLGNLNAVHFGTQSEVMYDHFHKLAINLAGRAAALRSLFAVDPAAEVEFAGFVAEAEFEALAYEAFGQHFLQDRWSSGHFWERWNASDYNLLPTKGLPKNFLIGAMSGIVHGAQAILGVADPLCSPVFDGTTATPIEWSHPDFGVLPAVGDYRWQEIIGTGQGNFQGSAYQVFVQYQQLIECGARGWAQVIRALGSNGNATYGELGIPLNGNAPPSTDSPLDPTCKGAWATNEAMRIGWGIDDTGTAARVALTNVFQAQNPFDRLDIAQITWRLWKAALLDPAGTNMARGGMGDLADALPGNSYAASVPSYSEPQNFTELNDIQSETGRDKTTIFGFFNRAHADHWCDAEVFQRVVDPLRGSPNAHEQLVCVYLTERMFRGTDPSYTRFTEQRVGASTFPACHFLGTRETVDSNDGLPYYVHPGYLDTVGATAKGGPGPSDPSYLETILNWCKKIPVMDVDADDFVATATIDATNADIVIQGQHLGAIPGTVEISFPGMSPSNVVTPVINWSDQVASLRIPRSGLPMPIDDIVGTIVLTRADGVSTVGERFVRFGRGATWPAYAYVFDGQHYFRTQFNLGGSTLPPCGARHFSSSPFVYPDGPNRVSVIPDRVFSFENPSVPLFNPDPGGCEFGLEVDVLPTLTQFPVNLPTLIAFCDAYRAALLPPGIDPETVNPGQGVFVTCKNQVEYLSDFEQTWPTN